MLSKKDNDILCRVGRGTPMGNLMREYWLPAFISQELEADGWFPDRGVAGKVASANITATKP